MHELPINQAASFGKRLGVAAFRSFDSHALLYNEWIALIRPPLFVKRGNASAATILDNVANPLRI